MSRSVAPVPSRAVPGGARLPETDAASDLEALDGPERDNPARQKDVDGNARAAVVEFDLPFPPLRVDDGRLLREGERKSRSVIPAGAAAGSGTRGSRLGIGAERGGGQGHGRREEEGGAKTVQHTHAMSFHQFDTDVRRYRWVRPRGRGSVRGASASILRGSSIVGAMGTCQTRGGQTNGCEEAPAAPSDATAAVTIVASVPGEASGGAHAGAGPHRRERFRRSRTNDSSVRRARRMPAALRGRDAEDDLALGRVEEPREHGDAAVRRRSACRSSRRGRSRTAAPRGGGRMR